MGSTSEDYLDSLLRAAMEPVKKEETKPVDEPAPIESIATEENLITEDKIETVPVYTAPIEENPMSADEIDAMLANLEKESVDAHEVMEEPIYATPVEENPMSTDEIDAMLADLAMQEDMPVEEKAAEEQPVVMPIDDNPNKQLTPEEIAAMFAATETITEPVVEEVTEEVIEEMPVAEEEQSAVIPVDDNPNRQLTPEEIAAMFAATETVTEPVVEEVTEEVIEEMPVAEEEQSVVIPVDDNPNRQLTPEEIAAMFAATEAVSESIAEEQPTEEIAEEMPVATEEQTAEEMEDDEEEESLEEFLAAADSNEEMEIDLDSIDDLDALLGLREVPTEHHWDEETGKMVEGSAEDSIEDEADNDMGDLADLLSMVSNDQSSASDNHEDLENQDLSDLLSMLGDDDSDLAEINDLLQKSDNNEIVEDDDMLALLGGLGDMTDMTDESSKEGIEALAEADGQEEKPKKKAKIKKKKEKTPKGKKVSEEATSDEGELAPKGKGFFGKLFAALTEEVEDEEEKETLTLDDEGLPVAPPVKKSKKKKDKKSKKSDKQAGASNEDIMDELDAEDAIKDKGKKKKEKKAKKPKKEKKAKIPDIEEPGKKLPKKMIIRIFILCFSLLAVLILVTVLLPQLLHFNDTRKAFYSGNYEEAYQGLVGQDLSDSDKILLKKAEILVQIERKIDVYDTYMAIDNKEKALDALFEGVAYYWEQESCYDELGIRDEANQAYMDILVVLQNDYLVEEERAREIAAMDSIAYTYAIRELASGTYVPKEDSRENVQEEEAEPLEDLLEGEQ